MSTNGSEQVDYGEPLTFEHYGNFGRIKNSKGVVVAMVTAEGIEQKFGERTLISYNACRHLADPESDLRELVEASDKLGSWMSAALDDPSVCDEMKQDINRWMSALAKFQGASGE